MTSKQISSDWKSTLRRSIYSRNRSQMQSHLHNNRQIVENLENQKNQALVDLRYRVQMQVDRLAAYETHSEIQNFIQLHHQIYTRSHLDYFLPISETPGSLERKKVINEVLKLLKYGKNKKEIQILWKYIVKKYTCPLDLLLKCEIYFQFLKFGTKLMHLLMFIYCDEIKSSVFFESILSVRKYIKAPQLSPQKVQKTQGPLQSRYFCIECSSYCCIRHHSLSSVRQQNQNQYRIDNKGNQIMTYFSLLADFRDIVEFDFIERQKKTCSIECYRKMTKEQFLKSYETFQPPDQNIIKYVTMGREMYGFLPCQIAQIAKMKCSDTAMYLLLSQKTESMAKTFGLSEHQYLKNISKYSPFKGQIRCFCRKCETQKCPCLVSKRQCNPKCTLCFDLQRKNCLNTRVTIGRKPWLRIGESIEKKCSLGLFSVEPLKKGELALWVSGQILQKEEEDFRSYFTNQKSKSSPKSSRLIGKDKFVCAASPEKANLQIIQKEVQGQLYLLYYTTKDIEREEELLRGQ